MFNKYLKLLICALSFFMAAVPAYAEYHGKHVIIAVDQTPDVVNNSDMAGLYKSLGALLKGEDPMRGLNAAESYVASDFKLEPGDRISLLGFGLPMRDYSTDLTAVGIQEAARNTSDSKKMADKLFMGLIHPIYDGTVEDVDAFVDTKLKEVCTGQTAVARSISDNSGVTLSHYVFPKVLDFVNFDEPSQEYNYVVVSNFKSGTTSQNTSNDRQRLREIFGNNDRHVNAVLAMTKDKSEPFYTVDFFSLAKGNDQNTLLALGKKIGLKQQLGTSVFIKSNLDLEQESYGSDSFEVGPVDVSFVKDESLTIDKVELVITDSDNQTLFSNDITGGTYDERLREYRFPEWTLNSPVSLSPGDRLNFKYVFYATPHTASGDALMPFVYVAERDMTLTSDNFITQSDTMYIVTILSIIVFFAVVCVVLWQIYRSRGKKALKSFSFNIWPISNTRFMDVSNNVVENYDCWYFRKGDTDKRIQVTGKVDIDYPSFAQHYDVVAEMEVQDVDFNDDFSFRPDGKNPNGTLREANKWYPVNLAPDGRFDTSVVAYMEKEIEAPDYQRDDHNVLRLQVSVRVKLVDKTGKAVATLPDQIKKYIFIVRPEIPNSDLWVAFDPGTSGSCVAYGYGGLPVFKNNIHLACNRASDTAGHEILSPIFYSKIKVLPNSSLFKGTPAADLQVYDFESRTGDFYFGNAAHIYWSKGQNGFQSIKKLLGYTNELEVEGSDGTVKKIKGEDLAHLLVKGLCHEFRNYIANDKDIKPEVRQRLIDADGKLTPSRAIVAVPNNYTVNKVQAMIDTVKRTHLFKEVHYIYEAEAVMMYYFNLNWAKLPGYQNKTFIVFDMGGATINATAFRIKVNSDAKGDILSVEVDTVSRVGYTVGGDNIDFALIKVLYGMPSMVTALGDAGISEKDHQRRNKKSLLQFVQKLKLDHIAALAGNRSTGNWAASAEVFWTNLFNYAKGWGLTLPDKMTDADAAYFAREKQSETSNMKKLVINSVKDAVAELLYDVNVSDVELILSGRSVLYPGIKESVVRSIKEKTSKVNEWNYEGSVESREEAVKTAVVRGACWYAMFSRFVALRHDKLTSTFGFMDMVRNESHYVPVLSRNTPFGEDGAVEAEAQPSFALLNNVTFLQMLGHDYDTIFGKEIFHKMNELALVTSSEIDGQIQSVKIRVDYNNNFTYEIRVAGKTKPICGGCAAADSEITDRNSEAYSFAALASLDDNQASPEELALQKGGSKPRTARPAAGVPEKKPADNPVTPPAKKKRF